MMGEAMTAHERPLASQPGLRPASLVLDIGGTKIAYGLVPDDEPTAVLGEGRIPSQPVGGRIHDQVTAAAREALAQATGLGLDVVRAGIGAPGVVDTHTGTIVYAGATIPGWQSTTLASLIPGDGQATALPIAVHNDVRIWAFGEHHLGAGRAINAGSRAEGANDRGRVLYVSVGTGIGGAVMIDGQLADGPAGTAGELSELVAADCRGMADRVENIASEPSLVRYYEALENDPSDRARIPWSDPRDAHTTLKAIIERYRAGETLAKEVSDGNLYGLGRSVSALVTAFDLEAVVLGGGVVGIGTIITDPIIRGIGDTALAPNKQVAVLTSTLEGTAPLVAAAAYARAVHSNESIK